MSESVSMCGDARDPGGLDGWRRKAYRFVEEEQRWIFQDESRDG